MPVFLFDTRQVYRAPVTAFGPNLAILHVGQCCLAFREAERVKALTGHFDWLVREAVVDARQVPGDIRALIS